MGTLILEEFFESGDGRFLEELRRTNLGKKGGAFADRWYRDSRPWVRRSLWKDYKYDRSVPGNYITEHRLVSRTPWLFTVHTRNYLRRRAWRYFRKLGYKDPRRYVRGRSIATNAAEHVGRQVIVNIDLKDFFPIITFPRVRGAFRSLGYSPAVATILALICTEAPRRWVTYDGVKYGVATGPRGLPQGACTSPALSNLVARVRRLLRARLHNAGKTGLASQNRGGHPRFTLHVAGRIAFVSMVRPDVAAKLRQRFDACKKDSV